MQDDAIVRRLAEAVRRRRARDPHERFLDLVQRGVIDKEGRVLKRIPEPPRQRKTKQ